MKTLRIASAWIPGLLAATLGFASANPKGAYYKEAPMFTPFPTEKGGWIIKNFGPVGIGITLDKGMVMRIENVEEGSPAAKTGKLSKGQIIESINGTTLDGRDPRLVLAGLITEAEAGDGKIDLKIKDLGSVTVEIPVLGRYSETWPLNCPKSDKIVRNLADRIAQTDGNDWSSALFLLSTGEEKDLEVVRGWMKNRESIGNINWMVGLAGIGYCEYYLRTGDASVLPMIQDGADQLRDRIYNGAWSGRESAFTYQSGGHLNAAGVHCLTFLLLAKSCGVEVDEKTLQSSLRHFYRFSGRGSVPYGDYTPKGGYADCNGKTGGLAMAMAAASLLTPGGEDSIYAQAARTNAMKSFYGTNVYHVGHTGGGIGEIWKSASMALMEDKRPKQYRAYTDARRWTLELSRRHDGGIGIGGGEDGNYDRATGEHTITWGNWFALTYTLPRKHLQLFGAPRSKWAKPYTLPERPWGTAADDDFSSPFPAPGGPWTKDDILGETLDRHIGRPVEALLAAAEVSDEDLRTYLHHPEITHRLAAKEAMVRLGKDDILMELLVAKDARLRHLGIMALHDLFGTWDKAKANPERVTAEMMKQVDRIIRNPDESWFVRQWAIALLQHTDLEKLRGYKDLLAELIGHEEHWIQGAAMGASVPLLMDKESYKDLFPAIASALGQARAFPIISRAGEITRELKNADPEIQEYGLALMKTVYIDEPDELVSERGIYVVPGGARFKRSALGRVVAFSEAGEDFLNTMPKTTSAWKVSGKDSDLFVYDGNFKPNPEFHGVWMFIGHHQAKTVAEAKAYIDRNLKSIPDEELPKNLGKLHKMHSFVVQEDGKVVGNGFNSRRYSNPMRYSGNMVFSTFADKAYRYEVFEHQGRKFMIFEEDFEPERDADYQPTFLAWVKMEAKK